MRHRKAGRKLGRTSSHRQALFGNLLMALITSEAIVTTLAKAKELKRVADKMITLAKRGDLHARRLALMVIRDKAAVKKLFDVLGQRYPERHGGYTRIYKLGTRHGDSAPLAVIEWVDRPAEQQSGKKKEKAKA
ncbi:MAG: 50S ribosomal protein L17 [Candidatus Tectomicrobia bacterium]|uniref:Large ribosomal subunit protein bL17 n=1 Tax=Tectimicrobiota bacterium TaxID=2528274 RepID=A0A932CS74_UNCTE|nr:50S ribosomal protein L17 [Candidatus Tectomicrobia bacterium]